MCGRNGFVVLLALLFLWPVAVSPQTPELDSMFSIALDNLASSANKIDNLQTSLNASKNFITSLETLSAQQKQTLLTQQRTLEEQSSSLLSINSELTSISKQLIVVKEKLKTAHRIVFILGIILAIRILSMIAGYIIYAKGIQLPRWLDILL